jgi:hypothetical protein
MVDRHFAGSLGALAEKEMRAHLPECASCRARYDRHLLYGELTGRGRSPEERLARGLGFSERVPGDRPRWVLPWSLAGAAAAASLALVLIGPWMSEFTARGGPAAIPPGLQIYEVPRKGKPYLADGQIYPDRELAFSYTNPAGYKNLMVFGIDDRGEVYWFYPEYTDITKNPQSVPISAGVVPTELEAAIGHDLRGQRLRVIGVFTNEPLTVREVEAKVRFGDLNFPGGERVERTLEIGP